MTYDEKMDTIKAAAGDALQKIAEAREVLEKASEETGYDYGYQIMQELDESMMNGLASKLVGVNDGSEDSEIMQDLTDE